MNDLIHRDLSSNNVLLIAGNRAKVTDFGMSKLADANPRMSSLTLCPGTMVYMPPEALKEPPVYSKKLDCFSHGVVAIQIVTRQFPNPSPPMKEVDYPASPVGKIHMPVPDAERRKSHIDLIDPAHPLLPLALSCLSYKEEERPSSEDLCHQLTALKEEGQYAESVRQGTLGTAESAHTLTAKEEQIAELQQSLDQTTQRLQAKEQQLQEEREAKEQQLVANEEREQQVNELTQRLAANEEVVADFQQTIVQKAEMVAAKVEENRQLKK